MSNIDHCVDEEVKSKSDEILSQEYIDKLDRIREDVCKKWHIARNLIYFTPHGVEHSNRVEEGIHELLKQNKEDDFSKQEWFLLLASAWLHDIGMIPNLFDDDRGPFADGSSEAIEWDKEVRETHSIRSHRYVNKKAKSEWGLNKFEKRALANICRYHRRSMDLREMKEEKDINIRVKLLTAYLRLADAIHIDKVGSDELKKYQTYLMLGMDIESKFHWLKAKCVDHVVIEPENFKIVIIVKQPVDLEREKMEPLFTELIDEIKNEIEPIKEILCQGRLAIYSNVEADTVLDDEADANELEELTRKIKLWSSPNAGMAIDSVLDAIESINNIIDMKNYTKYLTYFLSERPCHVYLHKVQKMLDKHLKDTNLDQEKVEHIKHDVKVLKKERDLAKEEYPKNARPFLINGMPILLYGNSDSVILALEYLAKDLPNLKATMKIYVCECSTKNQYRYDNKLQYSDGLRYSEKVKNLGFNKNNVIVVPDSSVSFLFKNRKVAKVFFGANGIRKETGEMGHSLGHLTIADAAKQYNIPVYVIAEFRKIGEFKPKPELQRKGDWLTTDRAYTLNGFKTFNPLEDIVPADRIKFLITELGAIPAERLPLDYKMLKEKRQLNLERIEQSNRR